MQISFDSEIAKEYGIPAAIILTNMAYWIRRNEARDVNFYEGRYWTYDSVSSLVKYFDCMSEKVVRHALKKLESAGVIATGNFNKSLYDRTTWYSIIDKSILQKGNFHLTKRQNGNSEKGEPIPDINTYINNKEIYKEKFSKEKIEEIYKTYPRKVGKAKALTAIEKALTKIKEDNPAEWLLNRVKEYANSPAGNNGKYTPHPATWFNQGRYYDDQSEWSMSDKETFTLTDIKEYLKKIWLVEGIGVWGVRETHWDESAEYIFNKFKSKGNIANWEAELRAWTIAKLRKEREKINNIWGKTK